MKSYAKNVLNLLLISLPAALFFSYHPVISFGSSEYMHFELSLPEIWLVLIFFFVLPELPKIFKFFGLKKLLLAALLSAYFLISLIWSLYPLRTLLTAGVFFLLVFAALVLIYHFKSSGGSNLRQKMIKSLLISAVIVSIFCWLQSVLDLLGLSRDRTLLCEGCVTTTFGFPHPNGFAIEPQFMGNLLITPVLLSYYLYAKLKRGSILLPLFLTTTLFFTFSRGAIYAFLVGFLILQILLHYKSFKKSWQTIVKSFALCISAFLISITAQGLFATLSPTSDNFITGTTKAIHHLSLGKIDLRPTELTAKDEGETVEDENEIIDTAENDTAIETEPAESDQSSRFSGYVEVSTSIRLNLNEYAVKAWSSNLSYTILGTGLGGASVALYTLFPEQFGPIGIVQNEYFSLLLETGLLGLALILALVIYTIVKTKNQFNPLFLSVLFAFLLTLSFFSGLPNALHLYLFPLLFLGADFSRGLTKHDSVVKQKV